MKLETILSQYKPDWENAASKGIAALAEAIEEPSINPIKNSIKALGILKGQSSQGNNLQRAETLTVFNQQILDSIASTDFSNEKYPSPADPFRIFESEMQDFLLSTAEKVKVEQDEVRFSLLSSDSLYVKAGKLLKRSLRFFHYLPIRISNSFKKADNKEAFPIPYQEIPLRDLSQFILIYGSYEAFRPHLEQYIKQLTAIAYLLSENDAVFHKKVEAFIHDDTDFEQELEDAIQQMSLQLSNLLEECEQAKQNFTEALSTLCENQWKSFGEQVSVAGTFEFSKRTISNRAEKKFKRKQNSWFRNYYLGWDNARIAIIDDLALSCELEAFQFTAFHSWFVALQRFETFSKKSLPELEKIEQALLQSQERLLMSSEKLPGKISQERLELIKTIERKMLPKLLESLSDYNYVHIIGQSESKILASSSKVSTRRLLVRQLDASKPLFNASISSFYPQELILLEAIPAFTASIDKLKGKALDFAEKTNQDLQYVTRIVSFNLSSAQELKEDAHQELELFIKQGFERGLEKLSQIRKDWENNHKEIEEAYKRVVLSFVDDILMLRQNESLYQLRMRLLRARAANRVKEFSGNLKIYLKNGSNKVLAWIRLVRLKTQSHYYSWREQLGLKIPNKRISLEVTEFLAQRELAYKKLSFVYRRLFSNQPLKDNSFYCPRSLEFNMLKKAFEKWVQNSGFSVLITGQKGSGVSTFLNYSLPRIFTEQANVHRLVFSEEVTSKEQLLEALGILMQEKPFGERDELQKYLMNSDKSPVIILEGIHRLFLRKTGGFEPIKALFEIISDSSAYAFWLCSCPIQAHNFLNKTIGLSDVFAMEIEMSALNHEQIVDLIYKRHRTSGFKVIFEPCTGDLIRKSFGSLSESQKQEYLRKSYFECLQRFSSNNISFALQMWVYSITKIQDNTIFVMSLRELDFSFLEAFSQKILFSLHAFIIHGELSAQHHAQVLNLDSNASSQILRHLTDKGILFYSNNAYFIHPLLYQQTVDLLESKNIIH